MIVILFTAWNISSRKFTLQSFSRFVIHWIVTATKLRARSSERETLKSFLHTGNYLTEQLTISRSQLDLQSAWSKPGTCVCFTIVDPFRIYDMSLSPDWFWFPITLRSRKENVIREITKGRVNKVDSFKST